MTTATRTKRPPTPFAFDQFSREYQLVGRTLGKDYSQFRTRCPLCGRDKLFIARATAAWQCKRCDWSGTYQPALVATLLGIAMDRAQELARRYVTEDMVIARVLPRPVEKIDLPVGCFPLNDPNDPYQAPFYRYLVRRGVDRGTIRAYRMHYGLLHRLKQRVVIPVFAGGTLVSYIARSISEPPAVPKILTPTDTPQGQIVFNLDIAARADVVLVTEGVFDALKLSDRSIATFGKRLSPAQCRLIRRAGVRRLVWCWDADAMYDAHKAAWAAVPYFDDVRVARLPNGYDPATMTPDALITCVDQAEPPDPARVLLEQTTNLYAWS